MLNNGRAIIENSTDTLSISIPSKKNWFALLFGTAWLGGWYFGLQSVGSMGFGNSHDSGVDGFLLFWTIGWTFGGLAIIFLLLWGYFGNEKFIADRGESLFEKTVFSIGLKRRMESSEIKNFRTEIIPTSMLGYSGGFAFWGLGPGKIKFDYGLKTYSFGLGVDDAEAEHLVELLKSHFKK